MQFIGPFVYMDRGKYITHITDFLSRREQRKKKLLRTRGIFYPLIFPSKEKQFRYAGYFFLDPGV